METIKGSKGGGHCKMSPLLDFLGFPLVWLGLAWLLDATPVILQLSPPPLQHVPHGAVLSEPEACGFAVFLLGMFVQPSLAEGYLAISTV